MKNLIIFTILLLTCTIGSKAQEEDQYHPMLAEGAFWDIAEIYGASTCGYAYGHRYVIGGDTVINNQTYKYFYRYPLETGHDEFCPPNYWVNKEKSLFTGAFLREDTLERKVYIYVGDLYGNFFGFQGQEFLHYDFTLKVGDTLKSDYHGNTRVYEIETSSINNITVQYYVLESSRYVQVLGGDNGLFGSLVYRLPIGFETVCHWTNEWCPGWINGEVNILASKNKLFSIVNLNREIKLTANFTDIYIQLLSLDGRLLHESLLIQREQFNFDFNARGIYIISAISPMSSQFQSELICVP